MTLVPPTPPESPLSGSLTDAGGREQTLELTRKNQQLQDQAPELEERATQDASAAYRAERLLALSIGLNEAVTVEAVADVIFREGTAAVDADAASLALVTRGAGGEPEFEVVRIGGFSSDLVERYHRFPLVAGRPMSDAILTLRPVLVGSRDGSPYPTLADVGYEAFAAVPVVHGGKPLAGIGFSYSAPKAFDEQMRTFLATMSHEIRTPINAVLGYTDLLRLRIAGPLTEEQERHLGRIPERARHLLGLIEEVLDLAKIEAGTLHVEIGKGRSGDGVDAALDIVRALAAAK